MQFARHQIQDGDGAAQTQGTRHDLRSLSNADAVRSPNEVDHQHRLPRRQRQPVDRPVRTSRSTWGRPRIVPDTVPAQPMISTALTG